MYWSIQGTFTSSSRKYSTTQAIEAVGGLTFICKVYQMTMNPCLHGTHGNTACATLPKHKLAVDCGVQSKVHLLWFCLSWSLRSCTLVCVCSAYNFSRNKNLMNPIIFFIGSLLMVCSDVIFGPEDFICSLSWTSPSSAVLEIWAVLC